jgi:DNA-binding NarL/FixJ family response regulator
LFTVAPQTLPSGDIRSAQACAWVSLRTTSGSPVTAPVFGASRTATVSFVLIRFTSTVPSMAAQPATPGLSGIEATRRIRAQPGAPRVLVLTTYDLDEYVFDAIKAGASGFMLKDAPADQLVAGIRVVAAGDALLAPAVTKRLIEEFARRPTPPPEGPVELAELTAREREILTLIARGLTNSEIAGDLVLGESTVKTHVGNILSKLDLRDRVQAVVLAYETGLVRPGG